MVRALLAQVGNCPIIGDLRYWTAPKRSRGAMDSSSGGDNENVATHDRTGRGISYSATNDKGPLTDQSVALHAYGVYFDREQLQLGSLDTFEFRAPVPSTWKSYFGIDDRGIETLL